MNQRITVMLTNTNNLMILIKTYVEKYQQYYESKKNICCEILQEYESKKNNYFDKYQQSYDARKTYVEKY